MRSSVPYPGNGGPFTPRRRQRTEGFTSQDGQFIFRDVPGGSYTLQGYGPAPSGRESAGPMNTLPFGWLPVTFGDSDADGLVLRVTYGATLRGRITLEEEGGPPLTPQQVRISSVPVEFDSARLDGGPPPSEMRDDWTFQVAHLAGRGRMSVNVASPGWMLKEITHTNIDITDELLDFRERDVADVEVFLTSKITHVTGGVSDEHGPVNDYAVVIFSSDPTKWIDYSRFVVMTRGVQQGRFEVRSLPPDDYLAVALPNVTGTEWMDPEFLQAIRALATDFTLQEGESKTLELTLKRKP